MVTTTKRVVTLRKLRALTIVQTRPAAAHPVQPIQRSLVKALNPESLPRIAKAPTVARVVRVVPEARKAVTVTTKVPAVGV